MVGGLEGRAQAYLHVLRDNIYLIESSPVGWDANVLDPKEILVLQVSEDAKIPQGPFGNGAVLEDGITLLDNDPIPNLIIVCHTFHLARKAVYGLQNPVSLLNLEALAQDHVGLRGRG